MVITLNVLFVLLICAYIFYVLHKWLKNVRTAAFKLYFIAFSILHFVAMAVFLYLLNQSPSNDAQQFYNSALEASNWFGLFGLGNRFMAFIIYPFVKLGITIEVLFLLFSTISLKGFLNLFKLMDCKTLNAKNKLILTLFLTPTIHFWTVFLGKEALLLWLMVALLNKIKFKKYNWELAVLFIPIFLIRPHVFFVLVLSLLILLSIDSNTSKKLKQTLLFVTFLAFAVLTPVFLIYFLKIEALNLEALQKYYSSFMDYTQNKGNTSISITDTTIFTRIFYLCVMPLPFLYDLKGNMQWFVAIENIFYVSIFSYSIIYYIKKGLSFKKLSNDLKFALIASVLLILLFSSYLYNLGLGNRMRLMFFPYIFYFLSMTIKPILQNRKR